MSIVCAFCQQIIARDRVASSEPLKQIGAYVRHLVGRHGLSKDVARGVARGAPLQSIDLPDPRTMEDRWMKARLMWAEGRSVADIADEYGLSQKALRTRMQRWRKSRGWFPPRG